MQRKTFGILLLMFAGLYVFFPLKLTMKVRLSPHLRRTSLPVTHSVLPPQSFSWKAQALNERRLLQDESDDRHEESMLPIWVIVLIAMVPCMCCCFILHRLKCELPDSRNEYPRVVLPLPAIGPIEIAHLKKKEAKSDIQVFVQGPDGNLDIGVVDFNKTGV